MFILKQFIIIQPHFRSKCLTANYFPLKTSKEKKNVCIVIACVFQINKEIHTQKEERKKLKYKNKRKFHVYRTSKERMLKAFPLFFLLFYVQTSFVYTRNKKMTMFWICETIHHKSKPLKHIKICRQVYFEMNYNLFLVYNNNNSNNVFFSFFTVNCIHHYYNQKKPHQVWF